MPSPQGSDTQGDPTTLQIYPSSIVQKEEHPSFDLEFPSSHVSKSSKTELPHTGKEQRSEFPVLFTHQAPFSI